MNQIAKKLLLVILISFSMNSIYAQEKDSLFYFSGQVLIEGVERPVSFAHVINRDRHWGANADSLGFFHIWTKPGDSLNISAIGFEYLQYGVNQINSDSVYKIYLNPRIYDIPEASIYYLGTYKEFEYKVLNLKLPKSEFNPQLENIFKHVEAPLFVEPRVTSPASLLYVMFSKDVKEKKKYLELTKEAKVTKEVKLKYNENIVSNITGLSEKEAIKLMKFCAFTDRYILEIDKYKLYSEIQEKYEAFKKSKEDSVIKE